jgi:septal ring-binding cell division protein DamX
MATAQQDTEITLGTGRMLAIFFALVLVCAFFFSIGFSLGRRTSMAVGSGLLSASSGATSTVVRPSAVKGNGGGGTASAGTQSGDFSFYKAVGEKNADGALAPKDSKPQSAAAGSPPSASDTSAKAAADSGNTAAVTAAASSSGTYYVQVAAVSRQEDAESLVEALKKKQYPGVAANNNSGDKFYHVQVGPYGDLKEAEAMKTRLIGDGYNPIVKK